jgi:hypothetical protein
MSRNLVMFLVLLGLALMSGTAVHPGPRDEEAAPLRVGVYDSRAIAVAFAGSEFLRVGEKMQALKEAKAAGDGDRVKELEAWGEKAQRQLHRQGFGRVPVTDLLGHVKDRLPTVAQEAGVDAITFECNYLAPGVEKVDITLELVMLFDPSERTLRTVEELRQHEPVDLDEIERNHDH